MIAEGKHVGSVEGRKEGISLGWGGILDTLLTEGICDETEGASGKVYKLM